MGIMAHHAIVITCYNEERIEQAVTQAKILFGGAFHITPSQFGYYSILIAPDGSKEGWEDSDIGDCNRLAFVSWLREQVFEDGSSPFAWVEVRFGADDFNTHVTRDSDQFRRISDNVS